MNDREKGELQRMMDVTRATLYFAKGVILVEGISEAMLLPILAKRIGYDLAKLHISVIPICGVAFETFKKLLAPAALGIPVSLVTDADPPVSRGSSWNEDTPVTEGLSFKLSDRTKNLVEIFSDHETVRVFHSEITLEYDLAKAGDENAAVMATIWEQCFIGAPGTFNSTRISEAGVDRSTKALAAWRGICRADHTGSKAEFAQRLADALVERNESNQWKLSFDVPSYLEKAITYVVASCNQPAEEPNTAKK